MSPNQAKLIEKSIFKCLENRLLIQVHSAFDNAINLKQGECFLSLLRSEEAASKNSIVVENTGTSLKAYPEFQKDTDLYLTKKGLFHDHHCLISFQDAVPFDAKSLHIDSKEPRYLEYAQTFLETHAHFDALIQSPKQAFKTHLYSGEPEQTYIDFCALIGLGTGLSPSGDDFCAGFIGTLSLLSHHNHISRSQWIQNLQSLTKKQAKTSTFMGQLLLENASSAYLPKELGHFISKLYHPKTSTDSLDTSLKKILAIGHSSGAELLDGLLSALTFIKETQK